MHDYSIDNKERYYIKGLAMLLAICIITYTESHISYIEEYIKIVLKIDINLKGISLFSCYGIVIHLYNKYFWKTTLFQLLFNTPNLNGTWNCEGISSHDGGEFQGKLFIEQTWTKIFIRGEFKSSHSRSFVASVKTNHGALQELVFSYNSEPDETSASSMVEHKGTTLLRKTNKNSFKGTYFTGRGRGTTGSLNIVRNDIDNL